MTLPLSAGAGAAESNDDKDKDPEQSIVILEKIAQTHKVHLT